jgi:putative membrane protein
MPASITPIDWTGGPALLWVAAAALLYRRGGWMSPRRSSTRWRTASFTAGLLAIVIALDSPIDHLSEELFWVHMTQHVLLIGVAAPLLALARPWARMWRGFPLSYRRALAHRIAGPGAKPLRRVVALMGGAVVSWLLFNVNFSAWHLPVLYDAALRWELVHALEHFTFFATALVFWTRVVDSPLWRSPLGELGKLVYLGSTMVVGWMLAIALAIASSPIYSAYAEEASRPGHISAFTDQQLAAGVMWVPASVPYAIAIVVIAYRLLESGESGRRLGTQSKGLQRGVG